MFFRAEVSNTLKLNTRAHDVLWQFRFGMVFSEARRIGRGGGAIGEYLSSGHLDVLRNRQYIVLDRLT